MKLENILIVFRNKIIETKQNKQIERSETNRIELEKTISVIKSSKTNKNTSANIKNGPIVN